MDLGLTGRTAVVCASTGGLGAATARVLAAEGADVVVSGRAAADAQQLAAELPSAIGVGCDLTSPDGPASLIAAAMEAFGRVDVLILNGPGPRPAPASAITPADVAAAFAMLVSPHVALVREVLPGMRQGGWGRILAFGSSGVTAPLPNLVMSNAGRAALAGYLKTLAAEVAADGVTVNMLLPGRIATDRTASLDEDAAQRTGKTAAEVRAQSASTIPVGRYGRAEEFAKVAAFLCSDVASYVTGATVRCDGGLIRSL